MIVFMFVFMLVLMFVFMLVLMFVFMLVFMCLLLTETTLVVEPYKRLQLIIHLAELCIDVLQQNEEHHFEVIFTSDL